LDPQQKIQKKLVKNIYHKEVWSKVLENRMKVAEENIEKSMVNVVKF
jgi:hypothetical protein